MGISGFLEKLKSFFTRKREVVLNTSLFSDFLKDKEPESDEYQLLNKAVALCDEGLGICGHRLQLIYRLNDISGELAKMESFGKLSDEDIAKFKDYMARFVSLTKERNTLRYQITGYDNSLTHLSALEDEAQSAVREIKDAEDKQRMFKQDVALLEGEKSDLEYERDKLNSSYNFVGKFTIATIVFFFTAATVLVFLNIFRGTNVFFPIALLTVFVIIMYALLIGLRRHIKSELAINIKKQNKAIEMLNKKNVIYAYYTNFLSFSYKKYRARNSENLRANLKDYANYKHLSFRLDSIRSIMTQTEAEIKKFLREKNIENYDSNIEQFARNTDVESKKQLLDSASAEKLRIEKNLEKLDIRHEDIWNSLIKLKELDVSVGETIDSMIILYMNETNRIISHYSARNAGNN